MRAVFPRAALSAALLIVVALGAASSAQAKQIPSTWSWTDSGPALRAVSCSAPGACVAVGQRGIVLRSTLGEEVPLAWSGDFLKYPEELDAVTCNETYCLSVSNTRMATAIYTSKVFRSDDGGVSWSAGVPLPANGPTKTRSAIAIDCDPADVAQRACYAAGAGGGVWRSMDGGRSWTALDQPARRGSYARLVCPAAGTCVAVGGDDEIDGPSNSAVVTGTKVTDVALPAAVAKGMLALACDRPTRCTATDGLGHFMSLNVPDQDWGRAKLLPKATPITDLACPIDDVCVGLAGPIALRTTNLSAVSPSWKRRPLETLNLAAITCQDTACVAVGKAATYFESFDAGFSFSRVNEVGGFDTIQCSPAFSGTCIAGGEKEFGVSRTGGTFWSLPLVGYSGLNVKALNCTGPSECLVLGKTLALYTKDLNAFAARHPTLVDPKGTDAQTCITATLCVGANEGVVYTTLDGAVTDWTHNSFPDKATSIACLPGRTDPVTCLATTRDFIFLGTMTQTNGQIRWSWRYTDADPSQGLEAVGCSPGGQCTAVGGGGEILTSNGTDLMSWTELTLPNLLEPVETRPLFKSITCPADGVCLAGGIHGPDAIIATTDNNWADFSYDAFEGIEGAAPTIKSFGCETIDRCVAVGSTALIGTRTRNQAGT